MNTLRARAVLLQSKISPFLAAALAAWLAACGGVGGSPDGVAAHVLVLVTDAQGDPVPGATVWVPADPAAQVLSAQDALSLVDAQGNACADPPAPALFAACTDAEGLALLPCGGDGGILVNYFKDAASGSTGATCGEGGVVPAPLGP